MDLSKLHIIGTSHVAENSAKEIRDFMNHNDVDVVCVELDRDRLYSLKNDLQSNFKMTNLSIIKRIGISGFIFAIIAHFVQSRLGKKINVKPGLDMLSAVESAEEYKIPVALIDQNIDITLKNLSKKVPFREKLKILKDLVLGMLGFKSALMGIDIKKMDLKKVPPEKLISDVLKKTKSVYPNLHKVLVEDRNHHMVNRIIYIMKKNPEFNVLVVIGAGHKEGMVEILEKKTEQKYNNKNTLKSNKDMTKIKNNSSYNYSYAFSQDSFF